MLKSSRGGELAEASAPEGVSAFNTGDRDRITTSGWAWGLAAVFIVAVSLAPFLVVDVPAVLDYPNHLARFYILAHPHDPVLSLMYAPHWAVLPNVGMDLLGQALLRVAPPSVGGRIILALSLLAPAAGTTLYARAAFGRWTWWSLGAGVIAFNGIFSLGFMNFLLGLGLALAGAAAWRALRRRGRDAVTALAGAVIGLAVFFCHLSGFGFFALLVGAQEADELYRERRAGRLSSRRLVAAAVRLAVALGPPLALYALTHRATEHGDALGWKWRPKLVEALIPFMAYDRRATLIMAVVVGAVAILVWRQARRASGVVLALALLAILYLVAPFEGAGGTFVDTRLPLMAALLLFAGLEPSLSRRAGRAAAAIFALLALGRAAEVGVAWQGRGRDLAELRAELA
ncbi:MAG: hypothetical protein JWQ97_3309 [Phenylobacterium sp.]|nr:hypothetical protein [Phenylobacterium sp.]